MASSAWHSSPEFADRRSEIGKRARAAVNPGRLAAGVKKVWAEGRLTPAASQSGEARAKRLAYWTNEKRSERRIAANRRRCPVTGRMLSKEN